MPWGLRNAWGTGHFDRGAGAGHRRRIVLVILDERTIHDVVVPLGMRPGNAALTYP
jgi:hypothetical protein